MNASEAEQQFAESKRLFAEGQFDKALAILARLDAEHPNDRHLLYPLALCLARVGRTNDARLICDRLVKEFGDEKGAALARQLAAPAPAPPPVVPGIPGLGTPGPGIPGLGIPGLQPFDLGDLNAPVVKYKPVPPEPAWKSWLLYGGAVVGTLAVIFLVTYVAIVVSAKVGQPGPEGADNVPMAERLASIQNPAQVTTAFLLVTLLGLILSPALLYGMLAKFGKLPYEETWRNLGHIALVIYGLALFQFIAGKFLFCCGQGLSIVITIVFVKRTYGLETGETILWVVCLILLNIAIGALQVLVLLS